MKKFIISLFIISLFSTFFYSQDCGVDPNYLKWANCNRSLKSNFQIYLQPKKTSINIKDTLKYNIVFNSNRDYIISFCTDNKYYPINIKLYQPETNRELYDNASDNYCSSIGVGFYNTQNLMVEITLQADKFDKNENEEKVCVGMILQWKKIFENIEN